ncbi:MAG: class I SAM-dependent methyltransferase [Deltaproteobacteria bacterium]|nr:class I SAM-dependent methyltransferase [Deltaproteobacteria bacterium]
MDKELMMVPRLERGQWANQITAKLVFSRLSALTSGALEFSWAGQKARFGRSTRDDLVARATVLDGAMFRKLLAGGTIGAAESYMDGDWCADDLTNLLRIFARDAQLVEGLEQGLSRFGRALSGLYHATRRNTREGSRSNIEAHYDLGNDFFELMLDETMTYSAGVFEHEESSLKAASIRKLDLLCQKLDLRPGQHLLEIGTGWGSLAIHAAQNYGCRVTTTTISKAQRAWAIEKIRAKGLDGRITVLDQDYRDLGGQYDKIVSCEMIEAIGHQQYATFFERCAARLAPGGLLALQVITIRDQLYERAKNEVDFIKRYIFPGSCIPSATVLHEAATAHDFVMRRYDDYTPHYARTLRAWRENLAPHRARVVEKYGERFWRMWNFYLSYCEAGFSEKYIGSAQMLFERGDSR